MSGSQEQNTSSSGTTVNKYSNTTTSNPFVTSTTNNRGTNTSLVGGAMNDSYNIINQNAQSLWNDYLNPNLNSAANQAKINAYNKELNKQTQMSLQNDILNNLYNRGLIRTSSANDMYNKLAERNADNYNSFLTNLIAESEQNAGAKLDRASNIYNQIYNAVLANQSQSLQTSSGNAKTTKSSKTSGKVG